MTLHKCMTQADRCVILPLTSVIIYCFYRIMTLVQSAILRSHVVCLSVRLSVTLVDCDHIGWNSSEIISRLVSLGCLLSADINIRGLLQGEHHEIWAQSDLPPKWWFHMPQYKRMAISLQRLIRSTYIARIARSSLRQHSFLVLHLLLCIICTFVK